MSRNYPERVRPEKVASAHRRFAGEIPLSRLRQAAELMESPKADEFVRFEVEFDHDKQGQIVADVQIEGEIPLVCQRSLNRFLWPLASRSRVGIVFSEAEAETLPDDYEPLVCDGEELELERLIEEELMLAVPIVPIDPNSALDDDHKALSRQPESEPTHRPFEVLARLKKK